MSMRRDRRVGVLSGRLGPHIVVWLCTLSACQMVVAQQPLPTPETAAPRRPSVTGFLRARAERLFKPRGKSAVDVAPPPVAKPGLFGRWRRRLPPSQPEPRPSQPHSIWQRSRNRSIAIPTIPRPASSDPSVTPSRATVPAAPPPDRNVPRNAPIRAAGGVVLDSLFQKADPDRWTPLPLRTFFTEGWNEPWTLSPSGSGGAPRQGWINAPEGVFFRLGFASLDYASNLAGGGDRYTGRYTLYTPLNRRFELRTEVPFVVSDQGKPDRMDRTAFGDFTITPRLLLADHKDVSVVAAMPVRTSTGGPSNGNGINSLSPDIEFWANVFDGWVARGALGVTVPLNGGDGMGGPMMPPRMAAPAGAPIPTTLNVSFGLGRYLTPKEAAPLGDFVPYLVMNLRTDVADGHNTFLSLTPGFSTHLGNKWYFLAGLEIPVTGPRPFEEQASFYLLRPY
jgi:hypothetical protein